MSDDPKPPINAELNVALEALATVKLRHHKRLPEEHPFYSMIGRVASEWAHLEHTLDLTIWELASWKANIPQSILACITSQIMGVGPRCKAIQALGGLRKLDDSVLKPGRKLATDAYPVADWRARWVHDPWYIDAETDAVGQFRAMPNVDKRYGIKDIEIKDVTETIDEIKKLQAQAGALRNSILAALDAYE